MDSVDKLAELIKSNEVELAFTIAIGLGIEIELLEECFNKPQYKHHIIRTNSLQISFDSYVKNAPWFVVKTLNEKGRCKFCYSGNSKSEAFKTFIKHVKK